MKIETIKAVDDIGEAVLEEVVGDPTPEPQPEPETPKNKVVSAGIRILGFVLRNRKLVAILLASVGLGSVSGVFTVAGEAVCSVSTLCAE